MIELILDTSYIGLNIGLLVDGQLIEKIEMKAERKQSEITMVVLSDLYNRHQLKPLDTQSILVTEGPGSFTGLRIGMTIAKVMASMLNCKLYTINTLYGYVHPDVKTGLAIMDARSNRAYVATFEKGINVLEPTVLALEDIVVNQALIFGDAHLINQTAQPFSMIDNLIARRQDWQLVDDVDALAPLYLKEKSDYGH